MTKVKTCGLRRIEDVDYVNASHPDYAGCILAEGFKRSVTKEDALNFRKKLDPSIRLVGVFVNDTAEKIESYLKEGIIDIAQLHGKESDAFVAQIQRETGKEVWKVFQMKGDIDYEHIENCPADFVLLDAGSGSGETFDWSTVQPIQRPFILAGGLTPENVRAAVEQTSPYAVDTSSGIETDGIKDADKIEAFVKEARSVDNE